MEILILRVFIFVKLITYVYNICLKYNNYLKNYFYVNSFINQFKVFKLFILFISSLSSIYFLFQNHNGL